MVSLILILFVALMLPGLIARTRARLSGRKGVRFYQHLHNVGVLLRKDPIYGASAGLVTRWAPVVYLGATLTAALLLPVGGFGALLSFDGDLVLFCYLLGLGRLALMLGAMDAGSSFQGMGASREALYGAFVEPALFLILGTLALVSGQVSFNGLFAEELGGRPEMGVVMILMIYAVFKIVLVEAGRIPVDDPRTHLELTMIHEVMVLDYAGFDMALITLGGWIKMALLALIGASALATTFWGTAPVIVLLALLFGIGIGVLESMMARSRLSRNTTYIVTIIALAFVIFTIAFLVMREVSIG